MSTSAVGSGAADAAGAMGRLADLARAGYAVLREPSMQVDFEIHHVADGPGRLVEILSRAEGGATFAETLSAGGNGVGVIVGTRVADRGARLVESPGGPPEAAGADGAFRGTGRPNPTFQHESVDSFEAIISIEDEPRRITLQHGVGLRDALHEVAEAAFAERAPLLSLQCPAQIPPHTSRRRTGRSPTRSVATSRSSSLALRFSMALPHGGARTRLRIADRLAAYCRGKGLGLWLADSRSGYQKGDWFTIRPHDRDTARRRYGRLRGTAEGCLPITLVGPARFGSTRAVTSFLARYPDVAVLACSMTPLDDLSFIHLQLAVPQASQRRFARINRALAAPPTTSIRPDDVLPGVVTDLLGLVPDAEPASGAATRALSRAGDYQTFVGPALPVRADTSTFLVPVWFSWRMRSTGPGLRLPVQTLTAAFEALRLTPTPTIEYLVCRLVGTSALRGKGKLAIARDAVDARFPATRYAAAPARLCADLEQAWRACLAADPHGGLVSTLTVSWRESWLGQWS